jgi:tetratricopeptide (TPR) repeat protein
MSAPDNITPSRVISLPVLGFVLAACIGLSWAMVPRQGELVERLYKDKQYDRVISVLKQETALAGLKGTNDFHLSAEQVATLSRLLNLTPREQLQALFVSKKPPAYDEHTHQIVLAAIRYVNVMPPAEAMAMIEPGLNRVSEDQRLSLLKLLAENALAVSNPQLSARCLSLACESSQTDWSLVTNMIQSHRWSRQSLLATEKLNAWLKKNPNTLTATQLEEAKSLRYSLAMASGQPSQAFSLTLEELKKHQGTPSPELIEQAHQAALQSGRTLELKPWLEQFVQSMPESRWSLAELHATQAPEYQRWCLQLAQWCDWSADFDKAFDAHLRLAALGREASMQRCLLLYEFLGRAEECCELLLVLKNTSFAKAQEHDLARLLAELGRDEAAKEHYEACLQRLPSHRDLLFEYASLLEDLGDEAASRRAFAKMIQMHPHDAPGLRKLAEACIREGDFREAISHYQQLPEAAHTEDSLENYAMIAESLDDAPAQCEALRLALKRQTNPTVEMYLDLADAASALPEKDAVKNVYAEGLAMLPDSAQLRIALAGCLMEAQHLDEALACLLHSSLKGNFEAIQMLLSLGDTLPDIDQVLAFMGKDVEKYFPLTAENRLQLALLHHLNGDSAAASRLFTSVPETKETIRLLAEARFDTGDFAESARLMTQHLRSHPRSVAADWMMLGDAYEELGRPEEAKKAYDYSLALLTAELPETAAN